MITQGWPLWAVRKATGTVYAVIGWEGVDNSRPGTAHLPIGVELAAEVDDPGALVLGGPLAFFGELGDARHAARRVAGS